MKEYIYNIFTDDEAMSYQGFVSAKTIKEAKEEAEKQVRSFLQDPNSLTVKKITVEKREAPTQEEQENV